MQIEQMNYLAELYKARSVTKAAENLHVTQAAISKSLKNLQEEIGLELFKATSKGVQFTLPGIEIVNRCSKIIQQIKDLQIKADEFKNAAVQSDIKDTLVINALPSFLKFYFPDVAKNFSMEFPDVQLNIKPIYYGERIYKPFDPKDFDIAILCWDEKEMNFHPQFELLQIHFLCNLTTVIAMSKNHELHEKNVIKSSDVVDYPFIANYAPEFGLADVEYILQRPLKESIKMVTDQLDIVYETLLNTNYLYMTSSISLKHPYVATGEILIKPFKEDRNIKLGCIYFKDSPKKSLIEKFIEFIHIV